MATDANEVLDRLDALLAAATPGPWSSDCKYIVGEVPGGRPGGEIIGRMNPTVDRLYGTTPDLENADAIVALRNAAPALIRLARAAAALDACHDLNFAPGWMTKQAACKLEHEAAIKALGEVRL